MIRPSILLASTLVGLAVGGAALAQDDRIEVDTASQHTRYGHQRVQATVQLSRPEFYAAREITQVVQTQDWDCPGGRYRIIRRVYRTADGQFVRSDPKVDPWAAVPDAGPLSEAFETVCPEEAAAAEASQDVPISSN